MKISRLSPLDGEIHIREIDCTPEQLERFNRGALVQDAFPHLPPEEREFLLTGITPDQWDLYIDIRTDEDE